MGTSVSPCLRPPRVQLNLGGGAHVAVRVLERTDRGDGALTRGTLASAARLQRSLECCDP